MKILMLTWEYPPKNIGGISNHVYNLARHLKNKGVEIHIITCEEGNAPSVQKDNGITIHRISPYKIKSEDFVKWVMQLNFVMIEECIKLIDQYGRFDIIHAHDWLTAFAAKAIKWSYYIPLVSTIHSTEYGRNNGIKTEMQKYISATECMLADESWKLVACSHYMRQHICDLFKVQWEKIWVIPNGVNKEKFQFQFDRESYNEQYSWDRAAGLTLKMYDLVKEEASGTQWDSPDLIINESGITSSEPTKAEELIDAENIETSKKKITSRGRKPKDSKSKTAESEIAATSEAESRTIEAEIKPQKKKRTSTRKAEEKL